MQALRWRRKWFRNPARLVRRTHSPIILLADMACMACRAGNTQAMTAITAALVTLP